MGDLLCKYENVVFLVPHLIADLTCFLETFMISISKAIILDAKGKDAKGKDLPLI